MWLSTVAIVALVIVAIIAGILWITKGVIYESFAWDIFGTEG